MVFSLCWTLKFQLLQWEIVDMTFPTDDYRESGEPSGMLAYWQWHVLTVSESTILSNQVLDNMDNKCCLFSS